MGERMTRVAVEAGTRSTDIASETTREAPANVREVTQVRDEPTDYGKAYSDFAQKQMDLFMRTTQSFADVSQKAGQDTTEVATKTGEEAADKAAANAEGATQKAKSAAEKAA